MSCDYVVIRTARETLINPGDKSTVDFNFDAPGIDVTQQPILSYIMDPNPGDGVETLHYEIWINDEKVIGRRLSDGDGRSLLDVLAPGSVQEDGNKLTVILETVARLRISDIVLLYK